MGSSQPPGEASQAAEEEAGLEQDAGPMLKAAGGESRQLHPLSVGLVELYGFLAVLVVLMPEWLAGGAMRGLNLGRQQADLPAPSQAWQRVPELRLAMLNLAELRRLACHHRVAGYGTLGRTQLTERLLKRLRRVGKAAKSL